MATTAQEFRDEYPFLTVEQSVECAVFGIDPETYRQK